MLLRTLVTDMNLSLSGPYNDCLKWIYDNVVEDDDVSHRQSTSTRAMAWLVLSNAVSVARPWQNESEEEDWIQGAIRAFSDSEKSVRQASGGFCYNTALISASSLQSTPEHEPPAVTYTLVSLLCVHITAEPHDMHRTLCLFGNT
mmetsp:Transcript_16746/g.46016  ORF Transcript_16746/g.46016 Transcript_16746/m.46016 type:complete len:145 (+) Transcript_16746:255-689(+)